MSEKIKITFVVPEGLQRELKEQIVRDNYGLRGKSRWICEAICSLCNLENFKELVNYSDIMHGFEKAETIVVENEMKVQLDKAILAIRKVYPTLEGVQSRIIRTAIVQRLLRS